uniref:Mitochondrial splicing suppressor 51-like C-terminal domain-containing protein n=1 Tax=Eutreptiella gymnastica TaxID=73025 RepID=A0A7S1HTE4_9EUGL|mmetsp:Transcript_104462/g.179998  ORF Transcript_104462/g.179998 Transcript_104462/m.179998 type:complete len:298 (+) Transcript_104462:53-946(+)
MDDAVLKPDQYIGTLRWGPDTEFAALPDFPKSTPPPLDHGWEDYMHTRMQSKVTNGQLTLHPATFDGLSFPLSFIWGFRQVLLSGSWNDTVGYKRGRKLFVLFLGAAERAEERLLLESNYFTEIAHYLPSFEIELHFVGPEISEQSHGRWMPLTNHMAAVCTRGTCKEGLEGLKTKCAAWRDPVPPAIVVCAFNTGFASGDARLRASWTGDIKYLIQEGFLTFFTCANDWADLKGEAQVMAILEARYVLQPQKSPFRSMSVVQEPDDKGKWYSANSFVYAVQGMQTRDKKQGLGRHI